jgi:hypothetical protein
LYKNHNYRYEVYKPTMDSVSGIPVSDITPTLVEQYTQWLLTQKLSTQTTQNYISRVKKILQNDYAETLTIFDNDRFISNINC